MTIQRKGLQVSAPQRHEGGVGCENQVNRWVPAPGPGEAIREGNARRKRSPVQHPETHRTLSTLSAKSSDSWFQEGLSLGALDGKGIGIFHWHVDGT